MNTLGKIKLILISLLVSAQVNAGMGTMGTGQDCNNPNPPPGCPVIPIDNHLIWLFVIGVGLAGVQLYKMNKTKSTI